ncbi:MAG: PocR ligand-binding domain-containing protein [Ruminiclostridium sp.]
MAEIDEEILNFEVDENLHLTDLIEVEILQKMQDSFAKMARMASLTTDENGVAVTEGTNFSEFCTEFCRKSPIGRARCEQCDKMGAVKALETGGPVSYFCHANLVDFAAPIMLGDRMIGSFIGGQVLSEPPDLDKMRKIAREIEVDEEAFVEAAKKTQIVPKNAIDRSTQFIYEFAGVLSDMAYKEYVSIQLNKQAMQATRQKSDFLANMSHEIRTPMNAVLGMAELALREEMSEQAKQYIRQIRSSGKNLLVIINDILDFSKIESGKMNIVEVVYEPLSIINDLANIVNSRIGSKNLEFTVDLSPNLPSKLFGDNIRIHQILLNLLNNAVKFTKTGNVHLKMYSEPIDENTVLLKAEVSDTGSGIKKEDLGKLFQSFQQVDSKRNRNIEGTGLGLAITQQLLRLMRGSVSVESEYNVGSTFSIELPQKIISATPIVPKPEKRLCIAVMLQNDFVRRQVLADLAAVGILCKDLMKGGSLDDIRAGYVIVDRALFCGGVKDYAEKHAEIGFIVIAPYDAPNDISCPNVKVLKKPVYSATLCSALGLGGMECGDLGSENEFQFTAPDAHVLIVDDNNVNLVVASGILEPLGMQIDTANGAAQAIEKVKQLRYDIIFMDHMMPEVDGVETTHIIRRMIPGYEEVPIIALTANAIGGTKEMFIREGMNDFVAKPIETKEIVGMVRKWLPAVKIMPVTGGSAAPAPKKTGLTIEGLNTGKAISLLGSEKLYMQVLREYYLSIDKRVEVLCRCLKEQDIKQYTIEVHAFKSTSRQIGADKIADLAFKLEFAGNSNNIGFINSHHEEFLELYRNVRTILAGVFPDVDLTPHDTKEADKETVEKLLSEMIEALDNFDTLAIDEVVEKMADYSYSGDAARLFGKLRTAAAEGDTDVCAEVVANWKILLNE